MDKIEFAQKMKKRGFGENFINRTISEVEKEAMETKNEGIFPQAEGLADFRYNWLVDFFENWVPPYPASEEEQKKIDRFYYT